MEEDAHSHCLSCYSFILCAKLDEEGDVSCPMVGCPLNCGAIFHCCKEDEHRLLCPRVRVPCLNRQYGCPLEMPRHRLGSHLERCPASVVVCMAEWNRWPVYSRERPGGRGTMRTKNPYAEEGQLDFDLALRDERMLNNFGRALSRKTRVALRNNLTRRHPAVPLAEPIMRALSIENGDDKDENGEVEDECLDLGDFGEVRGVKVDATLSKQMRIWQEELDERIKEHKKVPHYWEYPEQEKGSLHKHCAYCQDIHCPRTFDASDPDDDKACAVVDCKWKCGAVMHHCKLWEHKMICPLYEEEDEFAWMGRGLKSMSAAAKAKKKQKAAERNSSRPDDSDGDPLLVGPGEAASKSVKKVGSAIVPVPPPMPKTVQKSCRLDVRIESVTRLQTKAKSMYTFVCGQEFRRDEFAGHSRTVHNDILGGLNNWIEHRCPLSTYGCHFSARRMHPLDLQHDLRFSTLAESFGIAKIEDAASTNKRKTSLLPAAASRKLKTQSSKASPALSILDMPLEILLEILSYLDSFSLCNLAVTSKGLRDVVCSLLETRGCVALQWERIKGKGGGRRVHWDVAYKRWFFSSALDPVDRWAFSAAEGAVSNHLKTCPFNVKQKPVSHSKRPKKTKEWEAVLKSLKSVKLPRNV